MKDDELIKEAKDKARRFFDEKRANCAESVFRAIYEAVDTDLPPGVSALTTPLGGGVAIRGANCGAMLAGVMALALVHGRGDPHEGSLEEHRGRLWKTYSFYNQLPHRFNERFGTIECWDLTKDFIYGTKRSRENCEEIIAETVGMAMELLLEAKRKGLRFEFKKNLLSQAAELTGLSIEELIRYKAKGEPFPVPEEDE
jgi:C_GCAxxG_C_C family probable redox protein